MLIASSDDDDDDVKAKNYLSSASAKNLLPFYMSIPRVFVQ